MIEPKNGSWNAEMPFIRDKQRRSMSGISAFTHGVRFKTPLTPYDFAQGRLRRARGERDFESLKACGLKKAA